MSMTLEGLPVGTTGTKLVSAPFPGIAPQVFTLPLLRSAIDSWSPPVTSIASVIPVTLTGTLLAVVELFPSSPL